MDKSILSLVKRRKKPRRQNVAEIFTDANLASVRRNLEVDRNMFLNKPEIRNLTNGKGSQIAKIAEVETGVRDQGYNALMWKDVDGTNLYLENRAPNGLLADAPKISLQDVNDLASRSEAKHQPDIIVIKTEGSAASKMDAKTMVLGLLTPPGAMVNLLNKSILKETNFNPPQGQNTKAVITFSVKNLEAKTQLMPAETLALQLGAKPSPAENNIIGSLNKFYRFLGDTEQKNYGVEQIDQVDGDTSNEFDNQRRAITQQANDLKNTIQSYIQNPGKPPSRQADRDVWDKRLENFRELGRQLQSATDNGFKNELDALRWQRWSSRKPLTEDQIVPGTQEAAGSGAQGPVHKYQLMPEGGPFNAVLKFDGTGINDEAKLTGILDTNPQQSLRSMATFAISDQLNLNIVPRTEMFVGTDDNGRPKLGQAMGFVNGIVGQRKVGIKDGNPLSAAEMENEGINEALNILDHAGDHSNEERNTAAEKVSGFDRVGENWYKKPAPVSLEQSLQFEQAQAVLNNPNSGVHEINAARSTLVGYIKIGPRWYNANYLPPSISFQNPHVQKGLADLQLFDFIVGHADRNPANWIYETDNSIPPAIIGVKGIDNDDTFGANWAPRPNKTPDFPPVVDVNTALSILRQDPQAFERKVRSSLAGLSTEEINNTLSRFQEVRTKVLERVDSGDIAASAGEPLIEAKLAELNLLRQNPAEVPFLQSKPRLVWGVGTVNTKHSEENSYLGMQVAKARNVNNDLLVVQ